MADYGVCKGVLVEDHLVGGQGEDECFWVQETFEFHFRACDATVSSENVSMVAFCNNQDVSAGRLDFFCVLESAVGTTAL